MNINEEQFQKLIPQAPPMVMADSLLLCNEKETITQFTVKPDNIFFIDGQLQEAALIENMAQTAAARAGRQAQQKQGNTKTGFIGAVKNAEIFFLPKADDVLKTRLEIIAEIGDVSVVRCRISVKNKICAKAEFKIFLMD